MTPTAFRVLVLAFLSPALWLPSVSSAGTPAEPLTLRLSDAIGRPGSRTTLVLRTYSPRPVGQGQLDLRATPPPRDQGRGAEGVGPIVSIEEVRVFATDDDATWAVDLSEGTAIDLDFASASGTINESDGPLLAVHVELAADLVPGTSFELSLEPGSGVSGPGGSPIAVELRDGTLEIVEADAPFVVEADGDEVAPGGRFTAALATLEPLALSTARFGIRIDPGLFHSGPDFRVDPRYGSASLVVEHPEADLWVVEIDSPGGSLNRIVTGELLELTGIAVTSALPGETYSIAIDPDPSLTEVRDASGAVVELSLADDEVEIVPDEAVFTDGFESGDVLAW